MGRLKPMPVFNEVRHGPIIANSGVAKPGTTTAKLTHP